MKKLILLAVVFLALAVTGWAEGAKLVFYGGGGISLPLKPSQFDDLAAIDVELGIKDMYKSGVNFGGGVGLQVSPTIEIIGRVDYNTFSYDDEGFSEALTKEIERQVGVSGIGITTQASGGKLKLLEFMGDVKFLIPVGSEESAFKPFLLGGVGIANAKISESDWIVNVSFMGIDTSVTFTTPSQSETKLAFNLGAGFDWMVSPTVGIFVEGRYA